MTVRGVGCGVSASSSAERFEAISEKRESPEAKIKAKKEINLQVLALIRLLVVRHAKVRKELNVALIVGGK